MGVCAFLASGVNFEVDTYLRETPLEILAVFHKGEVRPDATPGTEPRPDSGFLARVSNDESPYLMDQFGESLDFLEENARELERMKALGADILLLDFRVAQPHPGTMIHQVPPELVQAMSRFRMGFVFSVEAIVEEHRRKRWYNPPRR